VCVLFLCQWLLEDSEGLGNHHVNWPPRTRCVFENLGINSFSNGRPFRNVYQSRGRADREHGPIGRDKSRGRMDRGYVTKYFLGIMAYCSFESCKRVIEKSYISGVCTGSQKVSPLS
jgi:hypothetical protein